MLLRASLSETSGKLSKRKQCKISRRKVLQTERSNTICFTFGQVQTVTVLYIQGKAWIMGCLAKASYLLCIIVFLRIGTGSDICLMTSEARPVLVPVADPLTLPKRTRVSVLCTVDLSHA